MLQLQLFGGFKLSSDEGQEIAIRLFKDRALFTYLALNAGKPFSRSALAGLLWSEQPEDKARHSLSQALSSICDTLGVDSSIVVRNRKEVLLHKDSLQIDYLECLALYATKDFDSCQRAFVLYDDEILPGIDFNEPAFADWIDNKRLEAQLAVMESGLLLLSKPQQLNNADGSQIAKKMLGIDPFCEVAHQQLIRQHVKSGNLKSAHRQFEACETLLREELGIEPAPETRRALEPTETQFVEIAKPAEIIADAKITPSLVVLPIDNISNDPNLDFLSLGLADDITTELTRYRDLFVISRESAFGTDVVRDNSPSVCRRLGVRHCLRGAFRRVGAEFRVNLHLVDGENGQSVWSERYDLSELELMALPGEITRQIVSHLATWLERDALVRAGLKPAKNWNAYDHLLKGLEHHHRSWYSTRNLRNAIKHFEQAIDIDPQCARAYAYLACAKSAPYFRERDKAQLEPCRELAQHAVNLDPTESEAHRIMGGIHLCHREHDLSRQHFQEAEGIHPGHAHILAHSARHYIHTGDPERAIKLLGQARQLNPAHPPWYWENLGIALFGKRNYREVIDAFSRLQQHTFYDLLYAASANALNGDKRRAAHQLKLAVENNPRLNRSTAARYFPYNDAEDLAHLLDGLKMAGLGE